MHTGDQLRIRTVEYLPGRLMDVYGDPSGGSVGTLLFWHGRGPDERSLLRPVAESVARSAVTVVVPDWSSAAPDRGRQQLLTSLEHARQLAADTTGDVQRLVLAGWSLGGSAAASLMLRDRTAARVVVAVAGDFLTEEPLTGRRLLDVVTEARTRGSFRLVHGTDDEVVPVDGAREFASALALRGHAVRLAEYPTDHAGIVMAEYDGQARRCRASRRPHALAAGSAVVDTLVAAATPAEGAVRTTGSSR